VTRLVLDTSVVVSALLFRSETSRLQELWEAGRFRLVVTRAILAEYSRVLTYPRFRLARADAAAILAGHILPFCDLHPDATGPRVCRDRADDMFLHCAAAARADAIVTGDRALLACGPRFSGVPILTVKSALVLLARPAS